ncbi:MAG: hypothetical protein WA414_04630 [Acidobacteriaceae bacterium]
MPRDRRTILYLVAMGRVTPEQAERLMVAWNDLRETQWIVAGCMVVAVLGVLSGHVGSGQSWFGHGSLPQWHNAISIFKFWWGGTL